MMSGPIIAAQGLSHSFGEVLALDRVSVQIPPGRIGLVGANGAGKTTLVRILLGMLSPSAGRAWVLGEEVTADRMAVRDRVGYLPEGPCLPKDQTAADFVGYAAELGGLTPKAARQRASEILSLVGLHEERFRYLGDFSTGMAQRVKLAQAIVHDPELVLLDEPTSGLDPEGREEMLKLIVRLAAGGINVLFSSHILADIERTCDWVMMLDGGKVIRAGPIGGLGRRDAVTVELIEEAAGVAEALERRGATVEREGAHLLHVQHPSEDAFTLIRDVLAEGSVALRRLGVASITLEDIFLAESKQDDG